MAQTDVFTTNEAGEKLAGIRLLPEGDGPLPIVILVHGFGVEKNEDTLFVEQAAQFADEGIASYRFDFSGCGDSEGDYAKTSLTKLIADFRSIYQFVTNDGATSGKIGIHAQSFGTTVAINSGLPMDALVVTGALAHPPQVFKDFFGAGYKPEGISVLPRSTGQETRLEPGFWKDLERYDTLAAAGKLTCPTLYIHGEDDDIVPLSEMKALYAATTATKDQEVLKGADHGLRPERKTSYRLSANWFKKYLA